MSTKKNKRTTIQMSESRYSRKFVKCPTCYKKLAEIGTFLINGTEMNLIHIKHKGVSTYCVNTITTCTGCNNSYGITTNGLNTNPVAIEPE